jgi:hypothetical protein
MIQRLRTNPGLLSFKGGKAIGTVASRNDFKEYIYTGSFKGIALKELLPHYKEIKKLAQSISEGVPILPGHMGYREAFQYLLNRIKKIPTHLLEEYVYYLIGNAVNLRSQLESLRLEDTVISNDLSSMIYKGSEDSEVSNVLLEFVLTDVVNYINGPVLKFTGNDNQRFFIDIINLFESLKRDIFANGMIYIRSILSRSSLYEKVVLVLSLVAVGFDYEMEILHYENRLNQLSGYVMGEEELEGVDIF